MMINALPPLTPPLPGGANSSPAVASSVSPEAGFARTLGALAVGAVETLERAETTSARALTGAAGPREVAEAVTEAERSLQIAVAVRDKIVSAFMEVSRMAI